VAAAWGRELWPVQRKNPSLTSCHSPLCLLRWLTATLKPVCLLLSCNGVRISRCIGRGTAVPQDSGQESGRCVSSGFASLRTARMIERAAEASEKLQDFAR
jgi:hypothetical protein